MNDLEVRVTDLGNRLREKKLVSEAKHNSGELRCPMTALIYAVICPPPFRRKAEGHCFGFPWSVVPNF